MDDKSAGQGKIPSSFAGYAEAHKAWFTKLYKEGIKYARDTLVDYAKVLQSASDFQDLPDDLRTTIGELAAGKHLDKDYCPSTWTYPGKG